MKNRGACLSTATALARKVLHCCSTHIHTHTQPCTPYFLPAVLRHTYTQVLAVLLLLACAWLARSSRGVPAKAQTTLIGPPARPLHTVLPVGAPLAVRADAWLRRALPARPPPAMTDPGAAPSALLADDAGSAAQSAALSTLPQQQQQQQQQLGTTAVGAPPSDAYAALRANYDGVTAFLTTVQNVLDGWAAAGERLQYALSWTDPVATAMLLALAGLLAAGLWMLGLRALITAGLLWVFRCVCCRPQLASVPLLTRP